MLFILFLLLFYWHCSIFCVVFIAHFPFVGLIKDFHISSYLNLSVSSNVMLSGRRGSRKPQLVPECRHSFMSSELISTSILISIQPRDRTVCRPPVRVRMKLSTDTFHFVSAALCLCAPSLFHQNQNINPNLNLLICEFSAAHSCLYWTVLSTRWRPWITNLNPLLDLLDWILVHNRYCLILRHVIHMLID